MWIYFIAEYYSKSYYSKCRVFNDKFRLSVIDLSQIELATEEDKVWEVDYWACLFKAKTWEELKVLAEKDQLIAELKRQLAEKE